MYKYKLPVVSKRQDRLTQRTSQRVGHGFTTEQLNQNLKKLHLFDRRRHLESDNEIEITLLSIYDRMGALPTHHTTSDLLLPLPQSLAQPPPPLE